MPVGDNSKRTQDHSASSADVLLCRGTRERKTQLASMDDGTERLESWQAWLSILIVGCRILMVKIHREVER